MVYHKWEPIQPVEHESEQYDFGEIRSLQQQWLTIRREYESSTSQTYQAFMERLGRSWAIETGIIEGLYTLDRGVTETLVRDGIVAEYIERSATNREPDDLVRTLNDHQEAIVFVNRYISDGRALTLSFIRQLHQIFTSHQDTYEAVDQFGNVVHPKLDKGGFKTLPNNPTRADGSVHEYCPPEQVDSELDNLLYFYNESQNEKGIYHPLLTGAWLHHRFTQIHPFQDGNGRVARALLTWHLVKEDFLPIVVSRDDRSKYIDGLESADRGDLIPFIDLLVQLEKKTILQALSEPEPAPALTAFSQVLDHIVEGIQRKQRAQEEQLRSVNLIARGLRDSTVEYMEGRGIEITSRLEAAGMEMEGIVVTGGPEDKGHYWRAEVIETAHSAGQWVNWNENKFFIQLSVSPAMPNAAGYPRLVFVISLHHVGRTLTGIMEATSFALITHYQDQLSGEFLASQRDFHDCTISPFTFTNDDSSDAIEPRFTRWIEEHLTIALTKWGEYLT